MGRNPTGVATPVETGVQSRRLDWIPAFAGMTSRLRGQVPYPATRRSQSARPRPMASGLSSWM